MNDAPSCWVLNAALRKLRDWVAEGKLSPKAPYIPTATVEGKTAIARDRFGNVLGGIRTPYLDAPVVHFEGTGYGKGFCFLNGMTVPLSESMLQSRYKTPASEFFPLRSALRSMPAIFSTCLPLLYLNGYPIAAITFEDMSGPKPGIVMKTKGSRLDIGQKIIGCT